LSRRKLKYWIVGVCISSLGFGLSSAQAERLDLKQAVGRALGKAPALQVNQAQVRVRKGEQLSSKVYPYQPILDVNTGLRRTDSEEVTRADVGFGISYEIETGNQQQARQTRANAGLEVGTQQLAVARAQVVRDVAVAYTKLWSAEQSLALAQKRSDIAQKILQAQQEQFKAGKVSQIPVNLAQIERQRAEAERALRTADIGRTQQLLKAAIGDLQAEAIETTDLPTVPTIAIDPNKKVPALLSAQAEVNQAQAELLLAKGRTSPSITPTLSYRREGLENVLFAGVSFPLTSVNFNQGALDTAQAQIEQAQAQVQVVNNSILSQSQEAQINLQAAQRATETYRVLVTTSEQNFNLVQEGFRFGKVSLFELLLAQRDNLDIQNALIQSRADAYLAYINLRNAQGEDL
jgi:outer membrane protein, heavy metal efflux system